MEYIPNTAADERKMLDKIGVTDFDDLLEIPEDLRLNRPLNLPAPLSQMALKREMAALANRNQNTEQMLSFLGGGSYDHFIPSTVAHVLGRSEFYSAYTPYQAELSQGLLQSIYEFQSMICQITDMDVAGASLYDGASALAEAALMAMRVTKRHRILVAHSLHPHHRAVLETYLSGLPEAEVEVIPSKNGMFSIGDFESAMTEEVAAVLVQHPNFLGQLEDIDPIREQVHAKGGLLVMSVDPISLALLKTPGEYQADIAVGEGQAMGNTLSYGGPYVGFFATRRKMIRQMPGRIVGATVDSQGRPGYCLTLQTREQHIKRERATSNICTNQALNALASSVYLATLGPEGLKDVAKLCLMQSHALQKKLAALPGCETPFTRPFFKEFVIKTPVSCKTILDKLLKQNIFGGLDLGKFYPELENHLLICATEKHTEKDVETLLGAFAEALQT